MRNRKRGNQSGFTLVELMVVLLVLTIVMGAVFNQVDKAQKAYSAEEAKVDLTQQAREFIDLATRDLGQSGYPARAMYNANTTNVNMDQLYIAAGIVLFSPTDLWFEGDVDDDGDIDSVRYTLFPGADGRCPCTLQRSQEQKIAGGPLAQNVVYFPSVDGLVNSAGAFGISGNMPTGVANAVYYADYLNAPVFEAFDRNGTVIAGPLRIDGGPGAVDLLNSISTVRVNLNLLAAPGRSIETSARPAITFTSAVKVRN